MTVSLSNTNVSIIASLHIEVNRSAEIVLVILFGSVASGSTGCVYTPGVWMVYNEINSPLTVGRLHWQISYVSLYQ